MIKLYELEDEIRFFIKNNITEFYAEEISKSFNKSFSETFKALFKFSEVDSHKINMFYETRCPYCKNRISEYTDILSVGIGETCKCDSCGEFTKSKDNTHIFFRATNEWIDFLKEIEK